MLKTPLYESHVALGAKMVPFGDWMMPVSYGKVLEEHHQVRNEVGIFDVSHMGEIFVRGPQALAFLQYVTTNDVSLLQVGQSQYSMFCNENGGIVDDLLCYKLGPDHYLLCVNAGNINKDYEHLLAHAKAFSQLTIDNQSSQWAQIAIQGPKSLDVLQKLFPDYFEPIKDLLYNHIMELPLKELSFDKKALLARTGYTGEKGYELYLPASCAVQVWQKLIDQGVMPIGLGARDTLRLEACYPLHGSDISDSISPLEAGLGFAVKLQKPDFLGQSALCKQKEQGIKRKLCAFILEDQGVPRSHMPVLKSERPVGEVTSGSVLPSLGKSGGLCLVETSLKPGDDIFIDIRGKLKLAKIASKPLYQAKTKD